MAGMVIVGAGEAGARAAVALRERGYAGSVTLIGDEAHPPYERPPLSKAVLAARAPPSAAAILDHARLEAHGITHLPGARVAGIDRAAREAVLHDGRQVPYRKLLLATGARPRKLPVPGAERALYLRDFADALALRERLRPGAQLAVIGGGFIGLEVAASAVERGCRVTLLEAGPRVLGRGVPAEVSEIVAARHRAAGVELRPGARVERIERRGDGDGGDAVVLAGGERVACDAVIAGVGAVPETALAEGCGLAVENGVRVDAMLATGDPDIYAAGDCCSFPHPLYGGRRVRLEAWRNAREQGELAAGNMVGAAEMHDAVPWFWSDQYERTLQVAGLPDEGVTTVARPAGEGWLFFHLAADGRLVAVSGVGTLSEIAKEVRTAEALIRCRARPDAAALSRPEARLRSLLPK